MPMFVSSDVSRPGFDLKMEMLVSLPRWPSYVPLSALVQDLELRNQLHAQTLIADLRREGHGVKCRARETGQGVMVCVAKGAWEKATKASEAYWEAVWEKPSPSEQFVGHLAGV